VEAQLILKPGREQSVLSRHPWIFSGAVERVIGDASDGDTVAVYSSRGQFLARGVLNWQSQIAVRLLTWDDQAVNASLWRQQLVAAVERRAALAADESTNAYRLVHAEADGLPGLIVDRYGEWLVVQFSSLAAERQRSRLLEQLAELLRPRGIYERSDDEARHKEGLAPRAGPVWGEAPPELIEIREHGQRFLVDVVSGHKTGFYLDQRDNRRIAAGYCSGASVLNAFAYTGGFAVYAAAAGAARIVNLDTSQSALQLAQRIMQLNGHTASPEDYVAANAFEWLRGCRDRGQQFDVIILDPPKFAASKSQVPGALRGYKDINLLAMKLLRPGGYLITFSCSAAITPDMFQQVMFQAALDSGRWVQAIQRLSQPADHPVLLTFPESHYLKGLVCRVE